MQKLRSGAELSECGFNCSFFFLQLIVLQIHSMLSLTARCPEQRPSKLMRLPRTASAASLFPGGLENPIPLVLSSWSQLNVGRDAGQGIIEWIANAIRI